MLVTNNNLLSVLKDAMEGAGSLPWAYLRFERFFVYAKLMRRKTKATIAVLMLLAISAVFDANTFKENI
jgi:hypothetical protein